jgi:prepilin signal peptidase PulO-like enzyme (type II secretory pathway)
MGWGDSALELSLGWLLGLYLGLTALMLAFWTGALLGLAVMLYQRLSWQSGRSRLTMKSEMPFAPFLVLGAALAYFLHVDFFQQISILF